MYSVSQMEELSRPQLYLVINRLKRQINCLNSDFMRFELHLKKYHDYFDKFYETLGLKNELMGLIKDIKALKQLNESRCQVSLEKLAQKKSNINNYEFDDNSSDDFNLDSNQDDTISLTDKSVDYNNDSIDNAFKQLESIVNSVDKNHVRSEVELSEDIFGINKRHKNVSSRLKYGPKEVDEGHLTPRMTPSVSEHRRADVAHKRSEPKKKAHSRERHYKQKDGHHQQKDGHRQQKDVHRQKNDGHHKECQPQAHHLPMPSHRWKDSNLTKNDNSVPIFDVYEYIENDDMDIFDHVKLNTRKKKYACDWDGCNKSYAYKSGLDKHMRTHVLVECPWDQCTAFFTDKKSLNDHQRMHRQIQRQSQKDYQDSRYDIDSPAVPEFNDLNQTSPETPPDSRPSVDYSNVEDNDVNDDNTYHLIDMPVLFCTEPGCEYRTTDSDLLNSHYKNHHMNPNKCEFCGRCFTSRAQTNKHIQIEHSSPPELDNIQCEYYGCAEVFTDKKDMIDHFNMAHQYQEEPEEVQFTCTVPNCGQIFNSEHRFKDHLRNHARRLVPCIWPTCDFKTHSTELIKQHMESHLKR